MKGGQLQPVLANFQQQGNQEHCGVWFVFHTQTGLKCCSWKQVRSPGRPTTDSAGGCGLPACALCTAYLAAACSDLPGLRNPNRWNSNKRQADFERKQRFHTHIHILNIHIWDTKRHLAIWLILEGQSYILWEETMFLYIYNSYTKSRFRQKNLIIAFTWLNVGY